MKAIEQINFFIAGHIADAAITYTALHHLEGFQEVGPAGSQMIDSESNRLLMAKIAVTALMVGLYALSRDKNKSFEYVGRRAMEISTAIIYLVLVSNTAQVIHELLRQVTNN